MIAVIAAVSSLLFFLWPTVRLYGQALFAPSMILLLMSVTAVIKLIPELRLQPGKGLGLTVTAIGIALWEIGWATSMLADYQTGWPLFISGWGVLALGLTLFAMSQQQGTSASRLVYLLSLTSFVVVLAELTNPFQFYLQLIPNAQLLVMLAYCLGWLFIGVVIHSENGQLMVS